MLVIVLAYLNSSSSLQNKTIKKNLRRKNKFYKEKTNFLDYL